MSKPFGALFGLLALVAILGVAPAAFGQTANEIDMVKGAGASASADCVAANNCFSPNPLTVAPGTTVTWKNIDTVSHYVTSGKPSDETTGSVFDSGNLIKPGSTYQFTFANAGTFDYFCSVHPWMTGQVIVEAASTTPSMTMSNMTMATPMSNMTTTPSATTAPTTMSNMAVSTATPVANTTSTTPTEAAPVVTSTTTTTPTETPQYATAQTASPSPGPTSDEVAAWVTGIVIFAIVSGIGIWTAVRRR
ncbi:MAG: cupredoxin domain-containing protein [Nitrosotalea sp.]